MKKHMNVPVFIPHLGCGHSCAFCSQRSVTNVQAAPSPESVAFSVREMLSTRGEKKAEIAFFGGSFTGIPKEEQKAYLEAVQPFLERGEAESIRISTRPDYIDAEIVRFLKDYGVKTIELGAQSMVDKVLLACHRGHTAADTVRASACILDGGLSLGLQMMTGLPQSKAEDEVFTAEQFVKLGAKIARIYPTVVFYDTPLYGWMVSGQYVPPEEEETVSRAARALSILEGGGVRVIRIGLQETETLGQKAAGGAYHPAIGEKIRARVLREKAEDAIRSLSGTSLILQCPENMTSRLLGHKRENILYLEKKYNIKLMLSRGEVCAVSNGEKTVGF